MSEPIDLRLSRSSGTVRLWVDDHHGEPHLAATIDGGITETPEDWLAQIRRANAAKAGLMFLRRVLNDWRKAEEKPDGSGSSEGSRRKAFAEGLRAGLLGETGPEIQGAPERPPDHGARGRPAHRSGWELGRAIQCAIQIATLEGEEGPK